MKDVSDSSVAAFNVKESIHQHLNSLQKKKQEQCCVFVIGGMLDVHQEQAVCCIRLSAHDIFYVVCKYVAAFGCHQYIIGTSHQIASTLVAPRLSPLGCSMWATMLCTYCS